MLRRKKKCISAEYSKVLKEVTHSTAAYSIFSDVESETRTYHGRVGSGRKAGWRGGVGQDWMPTKLSAQGASLPRTFQSIADKSPERLVSPEARTSEILSEPMEEQIPRLIPVYKRFIRDLSAVYPRFVRLYSIYHLHWPLTDDLRLEWGSILGTPPAAHGPAPQRPGSAVLPLTMNQGFSGMRHPGIKRPSNRETRLKAKLRANASPEDAIACRTRFFRPRSQFPWSWRPFPPICARLRTIWAKPPELGDYSGRLRRLIAHRFRTAGFGRVSVRNSSFDIFSQNLSSVSKLSQLDSPRIAVYISAGSTFQRDFCVELS